jgi:hypothetical protein
MEDYRRYKARRVDVNSFFSLIKTYKRNEGIYVRLSVRRYANMVRFVYNQCM